MKYLSSVLLPIATVILLICTVVHSSTCLMTSMSMCTLAELTQSNATIKTLNYVSLIASGLILVLCLPALLSTFVTTKYSGSLLVLVIVLLYLTVSAIIHSSYCIAGKPTCGLSDNNVFVNVHNILLMVCVMYVMLVTSLTHFNIKNN